MYRKRAKEFPDSFISVSQNSQNGPKILARIYLSLEQTNRHAYL